MLRQRSRESGNSRKWDFLHAVFECQIGNVKIDFAKLALKLGYKNERCAQDMYHRFRRAHFPERNSGLYRNKPARNHKQQFRANGKMVHRKKAAFYHDDDEDLYHRNDDNDDEDDEDDEDENERNEDGQGGVGVKVEDADMEKAQKGFWGLGIIDLEEEVRVKTEPGIKKEPVVEKWVWD